MFDLHTHVLPGIDDGPETIESAIKMANVAANQGTKLIVATPHRKDVTEHHSVPYIRNLLTKLTVRLETAGIKLKLLLGMENHLDLNLPKDLSAGRALSINGSRYALVELPFHGYPVDTMDILKQIQTKGITPILAHPERIEAIQNNTHLLNDFVKTGMLSQITAGSLTGHFGNKVRQLTYDLIRRRLVHIIASDTHSPEGPRSPTLNQGLKVASRIVGYGRAVAMVVDTPKAILEDLPLEIVLENLNKVHYRP